MCDVRVPIWWRLSLLLYDYCVDAPLQMRGAFHLARNQVRNVQHMSCRTKYPQDCGLKFSSGHNLVGTLFCMLTAGLFLVTLILEVFFGFFFFFFFFLSWNQIAPHSWEHCISINSPCHHLLYFKVKNKTCRQYGHTALNPSDPLYSDRWRTEILRRD